VEEDRAPEQQEQAKVEEDRAPEQQEQAREEQDRAPEQQKSTIEALERDQEQEDRAHWEQDQAYKNFCVYSLKNICITMDTNPDNVHENIAELIYFQRIYEVSQASMHHQALCSQCSRFIFSRKQEILELKLQK
jgi:hypothetical protein